MLKVLIDLDWYEDCSSYLFTGYRTTGIKAARALHRLLYETPPMAGQAVRGLPVDVLICFAGTPIVIGGLFVRRPTVHTATQSHLRWEMQQEASDEAIVVMKFL